MCVCVLSRFSRVQLFVTSQTVAHQDPLSMGFSRQEYWSGLPWPSPGDLQNLGIKLASLKSPALAGGFFTTSATWNAQKEQYPSLSTLRERWYPAWPHTLQLAWLVSDWVTEIAGGQFVGVLWCINVTLSNLLTVSNNFLKNLKTSSVSTSWWYWLKLFLGRIMFDHHSLSLYLKNIETKERKASLAPQVY